MTTGGSFILQHRHQQHACRGSFFFPIPWFTHHRWRWVYQGHSRKTDKRSSHWVGAKLKKIWQNHGIRISTKIRLMKALVWSVAMYGCESWTPKKDNEKRISAFEMKCLRQVLSVSWTAKRTNEWVLETPGVSRSLLAFVKEMKLAYWAMGIYWERKGTAWRKN